MKTLKLFLVGCACALLFNTYSYAQAIYPNGLVVNPGASGYGAWITGGNLFVEGSQCIGVDCDTFTTFGYSTLILKENNVRITFDDTSIGDFPDRDWELVANESENNGRNEFRIDDATSGTRPFRVTGGAPSNSLVTGVNGFLGVGVLNPITALHLATGDTPSLRFEDNGSSPYTWDIIGNEANFAVRDITGGGGLPFQIRPSAPAQSFYIANDGNIGLGTSVPSEKLEVNGNALINGNLTLTGQVLAPSDIRLKKNILPLDDALELLQPLKVKKYHYRRQEFPSFNLPEGERYGLIAQELEEHLPSLSSTGSLSETGIQKYRHVDYLGLVPVLVKALQELDRENQVLQEENDTIQDKLEKRQDQIEIMKNEIELMQKQLDTLIQAQQK